MILLKFCCGRPVPAEPVGCAFNHPVVMSSLIWAIVVLVVLLVLGKKIINLLKEKNETKQNETEAAREYELKLKKEAFEREKFWAGFETTKASTDEALKNHVKELNEKVLEKEQALKVEKHNKELLEKQLKLYCDVFEKLNIEIKPKEKQ